MADAPDFNPEKDYYSVLGVERNEVLSVIKKAHSKLALESHPDTKIGAGSGSGSGNISTSNALKDAGDRFREISEAWSVLSKPEMRKKYDAARAHVEAKNHTKYNYTHSGSTEGHSEIPLGSYTAQKSNYVGNVKVMAGSKIRDKYKTEKWQNLSLDAKKATRTKTMHSAGGSGAAVLFFGMLACGGLYMAVQSTQNARQRRK